MNNVAALAMAIAGLLYGTVSLGQTATDVNCTSCVGTTDIAKDAITTGKIVDGTIVAADFRNNSITGVKIRNGSLDEREFTPALQAFLGASLANITTLPAVASDLGVASVECPADRIPVSASCICDFDDGNSNFGVLFGCAIDGTGAIAGCFPESGTFDPNRPDPVAIVAAICLGGESADGTPWLPITSVANADGQPFVRSKPSAGDQAKWMKQRQDAYESGVTDMKSKLAEFKRRSASRR